MHLVAVKRNLSKVFGIINYKYPGVTITEDLCKKTCNFDLEYSHYLGDGYIQKANKMIGLR